MKKQSAGLLVYRHRNGQVEVLIAHMGAPWWAKKDAGAWSIPKGEYSDEDPKETARREFSEELGLEPPEGKWLKLGTIEQKNNKNVIAWAVEGDLVVSNIKSNTFKMEWPPRSGKMQEFPEIDRAGWFTLSEAAKKIIPAQIEFLERLADKLDVDIAPPPELPSQSSLL
jgi:predicted NUDIX family NTP pyrophosphohydrolase